MTDTPTLDVAEATEAAQAAGLTPEDFQAAVQGAIKRITMLRWQNIGNRYGIGPRDVNDGRSFAMLIVVANEFNRPNARNRDQFERFEAMTLEELSAFITEAITLAQEDAAGADKSE